jgi:hypothetical protein
MPRKYHFLKNSDFRGIPEIHFRGNTGCQYVLQEALLCEEREGTGIFQVSRFDQPAIHGLVPMWFN